MSDKNNNWADLWDEINFRIRAPWQEPTFVIYFVGVLIVIGSFGILANIIEFINLECPKWPEITKSVGTYFIAVMGTAVADLNLNKELKKNRFHGSFVLIAFITFLISLGLLYWLYMIDNYWSFLPALLGLIIAFTTWIFVHSTDTNYKLPKLSTSDTTGGDPTVDLLGSTIGYEE